MSKIFISVPTKLLIIIISTLLIFSVGFSGLSIWRLKAEHQEFQQLRLDQGQSQFELHNSIFRSKLSVWMESFTGLIQLSQQDDFTILAKQLAKQFDVLQLHLNVENIWLVDEQQNALYITSAMTKEVNQSIVNALKQQQPQYQIYCQQSCQVLLSVPMLNQQGDVAIVAMSASLVDMLYAINTSLKSDVAIISFDLKAAASSQQGHVISSSNMQLSQALLEVERSVNIDSVLEKGIQIELSDHSYLINVLPLSQNKQHVFYLSLIDDVTPFIEKNALYLQQFIFSISVMFIILACLVYYISSPFTKRLLLLSNALPLLAKKKFDQFRQVEIDKSGVISDELDIVVNSALELSYELEQLNIEVEQKTKELENIAMYDLLTGLPNRNMLNYQLRKSINNMGRYKEAVAVLFLDLDDFKKVNDSNGHSEGDKLLIQAANRVRLSVGKVDLACRFGGDEFVIVLSHLTCVEEAINIADQVLAQFKEPITLGSSIFYVSTSIGIAYTESTSEKAENLISYADIAMYEAKNNGGSQYRIYHDEMYQRVAHRVMLETEVRQALAKQQFSLSLQPQLCTKSKKIYGFEALLRWQHPERGMISPEDFIPILENSQHMIELGYWIIRRCFEIAKKIRQNELADICIAINLSAGQFVDVNLPDFLQGLLDEFSLPANAFELELTEQTLVKDIDHTTAMMNKLKAIGFSFAIDDFGTGYSSLSYLKKMPVDVIKIDKSFIFGMLENHSDYQIIMSTIAMVKNLGLTVIAEGVETQAQLRSLTENDCDLIQGYYFSKPVPEVNLMEFINDHIQDGYWKTQVEK
ncbi:MAG: EAL domain-containing protein [Colwellia sp.]